jgi:hypothetical protein
MKSSTIRSAFVFATIGLTIATGALAQYASAPDTKKQAQFARLVIAPRAINFGIAREVETKSVQLRNTGTIAANVTVVSPPSPFSIVSNGGSYSVNPGQIVEVGVQFAPTAAGRVPDQMMIQCSNCNTTADQNVTIRLIGNAREAVVPTTTPTPSATPTPGPSTANALPIQVAPGPFDELDQPFASVTICAHGTSNCTTVTDVVVDTMSFGLRIFGSQLQGLGITPNTNGKSEIGECAFFGAGSTWGSVSTVDVQLAGEPTITIPIQVMDDTGSFAPAPKVCTEGTQLLSSPDVAGLNGLLGIGALANDEIFTDYFNCSANTCAALNNPPAADQVPNPVAVFPTDNNGVTVSLPSVSADGEQSVNGMIYFGIGTEDDNQPGSVTTYAANNNPNSENYLYINTTYKDVSAGGFFDTGSNGYFFNDSSIPQCSDGSGFYCPAETLSLSATNSGVNGGTSNVVGFSVANADDLNSNDAAFNDVGGTYDGGNSYDGFDWGLPFFFGRPLYVGMVGQSSSLGTGPFFAY